MQDPRSTLRKIEKLAERAATPGERAAALAAAERLRARYPQPSSVPPPLPEALRRRVHGLLRSVEQAPAKDKAALLWWAASKVREKRAAGSLPYDDMMLVIEVLRRTALASGMGGWECERAISRALKGQPRDRR